MSLNFPDTPSVNDTYLAPNGVEYIYTGSKWRAFNAVESDIGTITATGQLDLSAGGSNQDVVITPSGSGTIELVGPVNAQSSFTANSITITPNVTSVSTGLTVSNGSITVHRSSGSSGTIYLSNTGNDYVLYNGTNYEFGASAGAAKAILPSGNTVSDLGSTTRYWNLLYGTATSARWADLAEKYLADDDYPIGTVISVGGTAEVTASTPSTSHSVVGVVSEKPAYLMNSDLEGGTAIALRGRVPVRTIGSVKKGDRLTVALMPPGYAIADNDSKRSFAIALHDSNESEMVEAIIL